MNKKTDEKLFKWMMITCILCMGAFIGLFASVMMYINDTDDRLAKFEKAQSQFIIASSNYEITIANLETELSETKASLTDAQTFIDQELPVHKETIHDLEQKIAEYEQEKLIDQYDYVFAYDNDMTDELVLYGHDLMTEKGLDPHLLFAIIIYESKGHADAYNSSSGASGLGQFLPSTARWVYEDRLGLGTYSSEVVFDPEINILMVVEYLDYLYELCGDSTISVLTSYSGGDSGYYYSMCNISGTTIAESRENQ